MKTCGIDLTGHDAIVVILSGAREAWELVACEPRKISLPNDEVCDQVRAFRDAITALVKHHGIDRIAIKKRGKKGQFAGGPVSFKMEGIIQLIEPCETVLLSPQTIAAISKRYPDVVPTELNQYQRDAFFTALTALDDE